MVYAFVLSAISLSQKLCVAGMILNFTNKIKLKSKLKPKLAEI